MNNKKKGLLLSILGILGLVAITAGVTYAFFNYAKEGTTENTITTGSITFIYEEVEAQGAGISISDALPMSDEVGKAQAGSGNVFNFKINSRTMNSSEIPYTVTARMKSDSDLPQNAVKLYLTEVDGESEVALLENTYDQLTQTSIVVPDDTIEKVIYTSSVPAASTNYEKNFRLRMWIPDTIDFSPVKDESGNDTYPYSGKKFTITVNVYANTEVVTTPESPTYTTYNIGDEITLIDGSKWHVLEASDENTETVVLLSDYNLNSDGSYNDECRRDINSNYVCSTMAFDKDNTNIYDETDSNNIGYFIKNTYVPKVISSLPGTTDVTLPTAEQIAIADGKLFNQSDFPLTTDSSWLLTTNYWTRTSNTSTDIYVWNIGGERGDLNDNGANISGAFGARPTITTLKSNIIKTMDPTTELAIGTSVEAIDGSKWHVLEASDENTETVVLLSDYNLNSDGTYNTECGRDINSTYKCSTMLFDPDDTNIYNEEDSNNIGYFIKNTYNPLVTEAIPGSTNVTIPTAEQISIADNQTFNQKILTLTSLWLTTTNYWTKTNNPNSSNFVWRVSGQDSNIADPNALSPDFCGARPVITTSKSNLIAE